MHLDLNGFAGFGLGRVIGEEQSGLQQDEREEFAPGVLLQPEDEFSQPGQQHVHHRVVDALPVVQKPEQLLRRLFRLLVAPL